MNDSDSFLIKITELAPWLDRRAKDELAAMLELKNLFPALTLKQLVAELIKYQKARRMSPEGFCERLRDWLASSTRASGESAALVRDFASLKAENVKKIAKEFDLNVTSGKKDAAAFESWLATGIKPPSALELYRTELAELARAALAIRDEVPGSLAQPAIESIMTMAEQVKKKYKLEGFREFLRLVGYPPVKSNDSGPVLINMLRHKLESLSVDRFKAREIDSQG